MSSALPDLPLNSGRRGGGLQHGFALHQLSGFRSHRKLGSREDDERAALARRAGKTARDLIESNDVDIDWLDIRFSTQGL